MAISRVLVAAIAICFATSVASRELLQTVVEDPNPLEMQVGVPINASTPRKIVIDTDPGIDDSMAIIAALNSPEVEIVGITSIFGNVPAWLGAKNAEIILGMANRTDIPVYEGANTTLHGTLQMDIASFVHGDDGLGNTWQPDPTTKPHNESSAEFLVRIVNEYPGEIEILAIGPLTNLAAALLIDADLPTKVAGVTVLGGAIYRNGNINPATEANIYNDPPAANFVLGKFPGLKLVGLDVTMHTYFTKEQVDSFDGVGPYGTFLYEICQFYMQYHISAYNESIVIAHDATAFAAIVHPEYFDWRTGAVVVGATDGDPFWGKTYLDERRKNWPDDLASAWTNRTMVDVALAVDAPAIIDFLMERMEV